LKFPDTVAGGGGPNTIGLKVVTFEVDVNQTRVTTGKFVIDADPGQRKLKLPVFDDGSNDTN
jgi:hypothetical protein